MGFIRLHRLLLDIGRVETIEWHDVSEEMSDKESEQKLYSVVFHMKSGKKFTRRIFETQLQQCKDTLRNYLLKED